MEVEEGTSQPWKAFPNNSPCGMKGTDLFVCPWGAVDLSWGGWGNRSGGPIHTHFFGVDYLYTPAFQKVAVIPPGSWHTRVAPGGNVSPRPFLGFSHSSAPWLKCWCSKVPGCPSSMDLTVHQAESSSRMASCTNNTPNPLVWFKSQAVHAPITHRGHVPHRWCHLHGQPEMETTVLLTTLETTPFECCRCSHHLVWLH